MTKKKMFIIVFLIFFIVGFIGGLAYFRKNNNSDIKNVKQGEDNSISIDSDKKSSKQGKNNLIALKTRATADIVNNYGNKHSATLSVDEVIRGEEALNFINSNVTKFNIMKAAAPSESTDEYLIAKITYTLNSVEGDTELKPARLRNYSGDLEAYPTLISIFYDDITFPELGSKPLNVDETITAYKVFQVKKSDSKPIMSYESMRNDNSDGLWFKLY